MSQARKRLEAMRGNPRGDWRIDDIETICRAYGVDCRSPSGGGSHYTVSHASQAEILTIPYNRPIKVIYIKKFVAFIDEVERSTYDGRK